MKTFKAGFIISLFMVSATAFAQPHSQEPIKGKLSCKVTKAEGLFNSFLPPKVGDRIVVDTGLSQIGQIEFTRPNQGVGSYIPSSTPMVKRVQPQWGEHMAVFVSDDGGMRVVLMVGRFWDGTKNVFAGNAQVVNTDSASGLTRVENADLACKPI